jgi:hypothetical protein
VLFAAGSCQRPFVDISEPDIEVLAPDTAFIVTDTEIFVRLRTTSFRKVTRVLIGDSPMSAGSGDDIWEAVVGLDRGLNRLIIRAFTEDDASGIDTLLSFQMSFETDSSEYRMAVPLGGHTLTRLLGGDFLIAGGTRRIDGDAVGSASRIRSGSGVVEPLETDMLFARMGHTASLLKDGRVLFLGGAVTGSRESVDDLVEAPEIFDPVTNRFSAVTVVGPPIRRIFHTASTRPAPDGEIIDLLGGKGDLEYIPEPLYGIRRDIRSFLLRKDSLIALSPAVGPFVARLFGQSQTALTMLGVGEAGEYLVSGIRYEEEEEPAGMVLDFRTNLGILIDPAPIPLQPRNLHAAVLLSDGLILVSGGNVLGETRPTAGLELFVRPANTYFGIPQGPGSPHRARRLHTATLLRSGRVLLLGGFGADGEAIETSEVFDFSL